MKNNEKIVGIEFFRVLLTVYIYSDTEIDQILTVYRKQSVGSKSVEIFSLSLTFSKLEAFKFLFFKSAHLQCNYLSWKSSGF